MDSETALITGASSGIGLELAKLFAADKSNLVLVARSEEKLRQLADELIGEHGIEATDLPSDLSDPASAQSIYDQLAEANTHVDVLVNNAGFGAVGTLVELPVNRQLDMIQVNITALTHLTRLFLPGMIERNRGGILNVGSTAGFQPGPKMAVYYATKAYVNSFTEALAEEVRGTEVKVSCLAPGATDTGFGADSGMNKSRLFQMGTMDSTQVARAGYRAFRRGSPLVVPGLKNKLGVFSLRFVPRFMVRKVVRWLQTTK